MASLGYMNQKDTRPSRVKNKSPALVQITAEQILRESRERQQVEFRPSNHTITDSTELSDYRIRRRKEFEDQIRRTDCSIHVWVKYAQWENSQKDYARARSVWERSLQGDYRNHTLGLKYAEFEMKNKFVNSARNVWDRAVDLLPRLDQLWCKYIHMEELLGNIAGVRQIFEQWMNWSPDQQAWISFVKFELRYNEIERVRSIYERFILCHPKASSYIRYAKFEMKTGETERARNVYERAREKLVGDEEEVEMLFMAYAEFEVRCKEVERARTIYKFALDRIPKGRAENLYKKFFAFEKQYGDKEGIEDTIVSKKRFQYEDEVRKNPLNYDSWFDYLKLEESVGNSDRIREIYERAVANVPPAKEKRYWQRYIYLWINYAMYEEIESEDVERTRDVYRECLKLIPHSRFSFAKIWLLAAEFEIRQLNLAGARKILGNAIGKAPKDKIFKRYIEIELQLGNIDRCRKLYERYLEWSPQNCNAWRKYSQFEISLSETERARAIFELGISQPDLDVPELLWKGYIDFEVSQGEFENARALYERLLDRTKHYKVWVSFAKFEASVGDDDDNIDHINRTRAVFERADAYYIESTRELKEERVKLLEDWLDMETGFGVFGNVSVVQEKFSKKRKILEAALRWKRQKLAA